LCSQVGETGRDFVWRRWVVIWSWMFVIVGSFTIASLLGGCLCFE
jgi:hypothetical protein